MGSLRVALVGGLLVWFFGVNVAASPCISEVEIMEALRRSHGANSVPSAHWQLDIEYTSDGLRLTLNDYEGKRLLQRHLPASDCATTAETINLWFERKQRELRWFGQLPKVDVARSTASVSDEQRLLTPSPSWLELRAGLILQSGLDGGSSAGPHATARLVLWDLWVAELAGGWTREVLTAGPGNILVHRTPLSLAGGVKSSHPRWEILFAARTGPELLHARSRELGRTTNHWVSLIRAGPAIGLGLRLYSQIWLSLEASLVFALSPRRALEVSGVSGEIGRQPLVAPEGFVSLGQRFSL